MSDNDEFDFDPDDFRTPVQTSAVPSPRNAGDTFDEFVTAHVNLTRRVYAATGGVLETIIHLATGDTDWSLAPIPPETLAEFLARAHDEALRLEAKAMFVARPGPVGHVAVAVADDTLADPLSAVALERTPLSQGVFYFAEQYDMVREFRHGIMLDEGGVLGEPIEGTADMQNNLFAQVLR